MIVLPFQFRTSAPNDRLPRTKVLSASAATNTAGFTVILGYLQRGGVVLSEFYVMSRSALTPDGTNYYTFKPFVSRVVNETGSVVYIGTPRTTASLALTANTPFRVHEERRLNARPGGAIVVGVEVGVTGTPASATRLITPTFVCEYFD